MLTIPQPLYDQLRAHGEETYPNECCGIILGIASDGDHRSYQPRPRRQHPHRQRPQPLQHRAPGAHRRPARRPANPASISSASTTPTPTTPPSGPPPTSPKPTGSAAPTSSHPSKRAALKPRTASSSPALPKTTKPSSTNPSKSSSRSSQRTVGITTVQSRQPKATTAAHAATTCAPSVRSTRALQSAGGFSGFHSKVALFTGTVHTPRITIHSAHIPIATSRSQNPDACQSRIVTASPLKKAQPKITGTRTRNRSINAWRKRICASSRNDSGGEPTP